MTDCVRVSWVRWRVSFNGHDRIGPRTAGRENSAARRPTRTTCVSGRKKRGTRKPLPKRCCCSRLIQWRRPPISSRRSSLSADFCLHSLSPPGLSDLLPSAARLPGLRASAGGSKFAAAAGDEASWRSACSSLVSTFKAVDTYFWLRQMASSSYLQQHGRQWAFPAPQPSECLIRLRLYLVCLELLFVGPVSGVGGGACALCMFLQ